jgi:hypothetical protein
MGFAPVGEGMPKKSLGGMAMRGWVLYMEEGAMDV